MHILSTQPAWLFLLAASPALAIFDDFYFAGNGGNSSAIRKCGDMPYGCNAPSMCSRDTYTKKYYCCGADSPDAPCWNGRSTCDGDGTNEPGPQQTSCVRGNVKYCCLKDSEKCTGNAKQFNICWSTFENKVAALNATKINETFWASQSADPSATSYTIDQAQLLSMTSTTPGAPSATSSGTSASVSASISTTPTAPISKPSDDSGLSGGAIGGIVGGVVGGLLLLGAAGFLFWRRRKAAGKSDPNAPVGGPYEAYGYQPQQQQHPYSPPAGMVESYAPPPLDKYAHHHMGPVEAPANSNPVEMDASYHQQQPTVPK